MVRSRPGGGNREKPDYGEPKRPREPYKRLKNKTKDWLDTDEDDEFSDEDAEEWYPYLDD